MFWKDAYPFTTGRPKSNRAKAEQMEYFLQKNSNHTRWPKDWGAFRNLKKKLQMHCEIFLLNNLGFDLKTRD